MSAGAEPAGTVGTAGAVAVALVCLPQGLFVLAVVLLTFLTLSDLLDGTMARMAGVKKSMGDYAVGEVIDHVDGVTVEDAEHMLATRLWQNTAKVHFNQHVEREGRFGKRIVYGGHVISIARAMTFNGLGNAWFVAAINAGRHVAPCFAGDTVYAWSEILDKAELPQAPGWGALRLRTIATKDQGCEAFPDKLPDGNFLPSVILELDHWVVVPAI